MLWREGPRGCPPPPRPTWCLWLGLFGADRPAESGELACGGDRDDRPAFPARFHPGPQVVQPSLGFPGERDDRGVRAGLAAAQRLADPGWLAVMPGRFDEQTSRVLAA